MKTIILGAGYAGLAAATALKPHPRLDVTLIDRYAQHQYVTRLHELAANGTRVSTETEPLLAGTGVKFRQASVRGVDLDARTVELEGGERLSYDQLVVAVGSTTNFYGIPGLQEHAMELKTVADANALNEYLLAAMAPGASGVRDIVVGGAGLTGVELVTELAHRIRALATQNGTEPLGLHLVEAGPRILPVIEESLRREALQVMENYGINVLLNHKITGAGAGSVNVEGPDGPKELPSGVTVWTGGIKALELLRGERLEKGPMGRAVTDYTLRLPAYPEVFVVGDMGLTKDPRTDKLVPTTAQHAWQQGDSVAANLLRLADGEEPQPFYPYTLGEMVSLGGKLAVGWVALPGKMRLAITGVGAYVAKKGSEWRWRQRLR